MNREKSIEFDAGSKQLFERLIHGEGHFVEFPKHLDNINEFGPNYLALQSMGGSKLDQEPWS